MTKPAVDYDIIEELYLDENNPFLILQAYYMTGHTDKYDKIIGDGIPYQRLQQYMPQPSKFDPFVLDTIIPPTPDCEEGCQLGLICDEIDGDVICELGCICEPPPPVIPLNECGCVVPSDWRIPAGCVQVDFDGLPVPVQIVLVSVWDWQFPFKQSDLVFTDRQGCWEVDRQYDEMRMKVIFINNNLKVRDTRYWFSLRIVRDRTRDFPSPPLNRVHILYDPVDDRREWAASHVHNTDIDYRTSAIADNITLPRMAMNYLTE